MSDGWKIKARVVYVEKERQKKDGSGTLISVKLKDNSNCEIRATLYNGIGDQNGEFLKAGREYVFESGEIQPNKYEMYSKNSICLSFSS